MRSLSEVDTACSVINANYDKVLSVVNNYVEKSIILCTCEKCVSTIVATALNTLPTHYYVDKEQEYELGSPWVLIESAVAEAVEMVEEQVCSRNPTIAG